MSTATICLIQYALVACATLLAGPLMSSVPATQGFPLALFGLDGGHTIRLVLESTGLLLLCLFSVHTNRHMPEDGEGWSFVRRLIFPLTALFALIVAHKALSMTGLPLLTGQSRYTIGYAGGLLMCGIWISAVWLLNFDSLDGFFKSPAQPPRDSQRSPEERYPTSDSASDGAQAATVMLKRNVGLPATLGRYKVLKEIGRGAMGIVYLGKDPTIQRFVAIKTMRLDQITDADKLEEVRGRFFREAESTGRLSHPNIVTIYDAGEEQDLGYIAMEVLEGTTLKEWSRPPRLMPLSRLMATLATVADALDYAHQQGIVHRDIKPANIMLTNDQVVKVMDFGIAKMASSSKTQTDIVLGTPTYMSPEQIAGKKVDGRSDIFSLGVVLFELLTGRPPFTADHVSALLFAIAHTAHTPVTTLRSDLPPRMQDLLDQTLHKDPVQRYPRARELARDLRACADGLAA
jgi:eukaryotic-like serine/threonine-protein kinase